MKEIESGIHEIHAQAREEKENEKEQQEVKSKEGLYLQLFKKKRQCNFLVIDRLALLKLRSAVEVKRLFPV